MIVEKNDSISRNKIINEIDKNFIVEAGAGSGKTTMLVNRMVALVEKGKPIDKICAITFTKAAAAEFYKRFQELLSKRSVVREDYEVKGYAGELPRPTEETAAYCKKALENIDLCFMNTIDAFCQMILSEHPCEAGIPSDAVLLSKEDMYQLYRDLYIKIRGGYLGDDLKKRADLFKSFYWNDSKVFEYGIEYVMGRRNIQFVFELPDPAKLNVNRYFAPLKEKICTLLNYLISNPSLKAVPFRKSDVKEWYNMDDYLKILRKDWSSNLPRILKILNEIAQNIKIKKGIEYGPAECLDLIKPRYTPWNAIDYYEIKEEIFSELDDLKYSVTMELLTSSSEFLDRELGKQGKMSFFDYLLYLKRMLDKDAVNGGKLTEYIYNRHSYIFIDEFQDTNPMQSEIFFHLTAKEPKENWRECIPREGSLFIVGDPKQSIYRFRGADVASYIKVKELFTEEVGEVLYLTRNFRSTKTLREYYNDVFTRLMPSDTATQCAFENIEIPENDADSEDILTGIYTYTCYAGAAALNSIPGAAEMTDAKQLAKVINRIVNNSACQIIDKKTGEVRRIKYGDIMVVPASKNNIPDMLNEFTLNGIKFRSEGKVLFDRCSALNSIYNIYAVVSLPNDSYNIVNALKSEPFLVSEEQIAQFTGRYCEEGKISVFKDYKIHSGDKSGENISRILLQFRETIDASKIQSPAAVFQYIMEKFEIFKYVETDNLEVLYYTLELIRNGEKNGTLLLLSDCVDFLKTLISGKSEIERCLSLSENNDYVHVANLHKVKGLEAPVVILTYWYPKDNKPTFYIDYSCNPPKGYLISCDEMTGKAPIVHFKTSHFVNEAMAEKEALDDEISRLIYVAATRPENTLILCKSLMGKDGKFKSRWNSLFDDCINDSSYLNKYDNDIFSEVAKRENILRENGEGEFGLDNILNTLVNNRQETVSAESLYDLSDENNVLNNRDAEKPSFTVLTPSGLKTDSALESEAAENRIVTSVISEDEERFLRQRSDILGTAVHKLMELLVTSKGKLDISNCISNIADEYVSAADDEYKKVLIKALNAVGDTITNEGYKQNNGCIQDIFNELISADEVHCEVPFAYMDGDIVWNGIMDAIYKKDGKWHIIDYKTNAESGNLDIKYKEQLASYIKAFKNIAGEDADALIYHIDI